MRTFRLTNPTTLLLAVAAALISAFAPSPLSLGGTALAQNFRIASLYHNSATLQWEIPQNRGITKFELWQYNPDGSSFIDWQGQANEGEGYTAFPGPLEPDTQYRLVLKLMDDSGTTIIEKSLSLRTKPDPDSDPTPDPDPPTPDPDPPTPDPDPPPPPPPPVTGELPTDDPPVNFRIASLYHNSATLQWETPQNRGITKFELWQYNPDGSSFIDWQGQVNERGYTAFPGPLEPDTQYRLVLKLMDDSGTTIIEKSLSLRTKPAPDPLSIVAIRSPGSGQPGDALTFVVEVRANGSPSSGQTVSFSVSPDAGAKALSITSAITGSTGRAQTMLTLPSDASGTYTITATLANGLAASGTATVAGSSDDGFATDESGADRTAQQPESDGADSGPSTDGTAQQPESDGARATEQTSDSQEDPESDPLASLSTTIDDVTSAAERGRMTFTVRLEPAPTAPTAVKYATASRTARAGVDYEVASGTLDFDADQSTATFTVLIRRDAQDEPDETFGVRIVHPSTGALLAEATGTITDDDSATPPEADSDSDSERAFVFAAEVGDQAYTAGTAITALELPEATGGAGEVTYGLSTLPAGLSFDAATRTISGTPEAATDGAVEVTYTAADSTGAATGLTFSITVNPALSFGDLSDLLDGEAGEEDTGGG